MHRHHVSLGLALTGLVIAALASAGSPATAESPASASGQLEVLHEDRFDDHSTHRYQLLEADGGRLELLFDDRGPEGLGGRSIRVSGTRVRPGVMYVGGSSAVAEAGGGSSSGTTATATAAVTKKVAVILYDFADSDHTARPVTAAEAQATVFSSTTKSVRQFLTETSFSQLALSGASTPEGDVFEWVTVDAASTDACAYGTWGQQARARAAAQGFVDANYDQVIHLMPKSTCTFGGVAYMPGKYSWTVLRAVGDVNLIPALRRVTAHEYGHNLGIHHAGSYRCTDSAGNWATLGSSCTLSEYGDPFSVLGMSPGERQYHGYQKGRVSWVTSANTTTVTTSGTYSLASISVPSASGSQLLRIARPKTRGQSDYYYLELRQPSGAFDNFATTDAVVNGLSIRIAPDFGTNAVSKLLDTTPGSILTPADRSIGEGGDFTDAALAVGRTFTDSATGLSVRLASLASGVAQVEVTMPPASTTGRK